MSSSGSGPGPGPVIRHGWGVRSIILRRGERNFADGPIVKYLLNIWKLEHNNIALCAIWESEEPEERGRENAL